MAVGGVIETKEIGLSIGTGGTFNNTFLDSTDGKIKLAIKEFDGNGNPVYVEEGYWISNIIDLQDNFLDYEKIFADYIDNGVSNISIETRVSSDKVTWDDWVAVAYDGAIQSETKQFIQIKITFFAGFVTDVFLISEFDNAEDKELFDSEYIDTSNGLRLKRDYSFDMTMDSTWTDEGSLHKKVISRNEWIKIDKLNVVSKVVG